jgi:phage baseplate assembly protein W
MDFSPHPQTGDVILVTGINSVVQSVMNLCQLNHYEVPFHPEIGGNIRKLLFELADPVTADLLAKEITDTITNFEPRVAVENVNVIADFVNQGYQVTIIFLIIGSTRPITVNFFLQRIR